MTTQTRWLTRLAMGTAVAAVCLFVNENVSLTQSSSLVSQADARVGRPLTPLSGAGVARRHYRRGVARGAAVGVGAAAVGAGAYYGARRGYYGGYGAGCYRNAYGALVCP
jgi:hypothetical protein